MQGRDRSDPNETIAEFGAMSSQIFKWEKAFFEDGKQVFMDNTQLSFERAQIEKLHNMIKRLAVEYSFLEKCAKGER